VRRTWRPTLCVIPWRVRSLDGCGGLDVRRTRLRRDRDVCVIPWRVTGAADLASDAVCVIPWRVTVVAVVVTVKVVDKSDRRLVSSFNNSLLLRT
jgi:hypothetical protein